jgi:uncharacterized protein
MSDTAAAPTLVPGQIGWIDLTVPNAEAVREFYQHVAGWSASPISMGDHNDYCMIPAGGGAPIGGICHALGENAGQPPVWMIYITVSDLEASIRQVEQRGGKIRVPIRKAGGGRFCVIEDPAGAIAGLYQS